MGSAILVSYLLLPFYLYDVNNRQRTVKLIIQRKENLMGKRKTKKGKQWKAKVLGFVAMIVFFYVVNLAGGCQSVLTKASYDIDTNIIGIFR